MEDNYVKVNIKESVRNRLKQMAAEKGMTLADLIASFVDSNIDEADALLKQLDKQHDDPSAGFTQKEKDLLEGLGPTELPECCRHIYDDPADPKWTCPHWEIAFVNYYGNKIRHYRNKLTGMSYFDYKNKYMEM